MITREELIAGINEIDENNFEILQRIIAAFRMPPSDRQSVPGMGGNPLKDSVTFEKDILSPVDENWDVEL